jgi:hypothetical protein
VEKFFFCNRKGDMPFHVPIENHRMDVAELESPDDWMRKFWVKPVNIWLLKRDTQWIWP